MAIAHYFCQVSGKDVTVVVDSSIIPLLTKNVFTNFSDLSKYTVEVRQQNASILS